MKLEHNIFVIGSNSFTGAHFVNKSLSVTSGKVIGISRSKEYHEVFLPYKNAQNNYRFSFHQLDVNKDLDKILDLCDAYEPAYIANFAAQGEVRNSWKYPDQWFETNCLSVVRLTNELCKRSYLKGYLSCSTPEVYGSTHQNMKENHHYFPSTPYASSKLSGDLHLFTLWKHYGFPVVFTRSANVFGIHQQLYRIIPRTIIYLKLGKKLQLHGNGKSLRSFIHVSDVAEAAMLALVKSKSGEVYHVGPNESATSIYSLVKLVCEMMNENFDDNVELISENFGQDAMYSLNCAKITNSLGWSPKVNLKDGILETINWIKANWNLIKSLPLDYIHRS